MLTPFFRTNHNFLLSPFTDGFAVPVGYYDARVKQLRLVKQGNVWPGSSDLLTLITSHDDPMDAIFKLNLSNKIEIFFLVITGGRIPRDRTITVTEFVQIPLWLIVSTNILAFLGIALASFFLWFNFHYRAKR